MSTLIKILLNGIAIYWKSLKAWKQLCLLRVKYHSWPWSTSSAITGSAVLHYNFSVLVYIYTDVDYQSEDHLWQHARSPIIPFMVFLVILHWHSLWTIHVNHFLYIILCKCKWIRTKTQDSFCSYLVSLCPFLQVQIFTFASFLEKKKKWQCFAVHKGYYHGICSN